MKVSIDTEIFGYPLDTTDALGIPARWCFSFLDSLIVAAALTAGCSRLLSENLPHGQHIEALTIHNPFKR